MSFTSVLPTPQIILKAKPAPPTDKAKGIDTLVSLTAYAAPRDAAKGVDALSALTASIPPQLDTAKAIDLPALAGPGLHGYILRLVKKGDIILPDDQNNLVYAWKAKIDKLSEIEPKLRLFDPTLADTLAAYISELKSIVDTMPLVKEGDWVYSDHFNLHLRALKKLIEIEEWLTTEVQGSPSEMLQLLYAMKSYEWLLSERKAGDVVASADWNALKLALSVAHGMDERVLARPIPYTPSCLNPNDPLWAPIDGWTYVYNFASDDEVRQAFYDVSGYEVVEDGVLGWSLPPGKGGFAWQYVEGVAWKKMAVCLKIRPIDVYMNFAYYIYFDSYIAPNSAVDVGFHVVEGSTTMKIKDTFSGGGAWDPPIYDFTPPDDWIVIVVENYPDRPAYLRIYDSRKNLLFQLQLARGTTDRTWADAWFMADNGTEFGVIDVKIDWFALKY
jgi:hypothetical protein